MKRKPKRTASVAKRKTVAQRLLEAREDGRSAGYEAGRFDAQRQFRLLDHRAAAISKLVGNIDNLKDVDGAVAQIFVTNLATHAQAFMPFDHLKAVAAELKRLGLVV